MQAVFHTNTQELDIKFLEFLKSNFQNAEIDIFVKEMDETEYLNSSPENKKRLESAIQKVNKKQFINKSLQELGL